MTSKYLFDEHRPIPYALSQWDSGTEILYKCAKCGCDFRTLTCLVVGQRSISLFPILI